MKLQFYNFFIWQNKTYLTNAERKEAKIMNDKFKVGMENRKIRKRVAEENTDKMNNAQRKNMLK